MLKFLNENIGNILQDIGVRKKFLNRILTEQELTSGMNKRAYMKIKVFCQQEKLLS